MKKVGILAGTFDPVHAGHVAFAIKAIKTTGLDKVYFLPEPTPRSKNQVTSYYHRLKMLKLVIADHPQLAVLELPGQQFNVASTLPILKKRFAGSQINFLMGSDVASGLGGWPAAADLLQDYRLIIGLRASDDKALLKGLISNVLASAKPVFIASPMPHSASSRIRAQGAVQMINQDVADYVESNGLYNSQKNSSQAPDKVDYK